MDVLTKITPFVAWLAKAKARRVNNEALCSHEDFFSVGMLGVVTSLRKHADQPPAQRAKVARRRAEGAMLDYQRSVDHLTRRQRAEVRALQKGQPAERYAEWLSRVQIEPGHVLDHVEYEQQELTPELLDLRRALAKLPTRERLVLRQLYYWELTAAEVASTMGLCSSRISQIKASALKHMRNILNAGRCAPQGGECEDPKKDRCSG
jgi:RNA polymerase sigma factor for flagellar operon FliA